MEMEERRESTCSMPVFSPQSEKLKVLKRAELLASGWEVNKIKAIKILKENIIEILYFLGILCISTAGFLTDIKMGFLSLGIMLVAVATLALKKGV